MNNQNRAACARFLPNRIGRRVLRFQQLGLLFWREVTRLSLNLVPGDFAVTSSACRLVEGGCGVSPGHFLHPRRWD